MDQTQTTNKSNENTEPPPRAAKKSFWKRRPVIVVGVLLFGALLYYGLVHLAFTLTHETTDNAFLESDVAAIGPKVSGEVKAVHVNDNQTVTAGDLLLEIDPRDFEMVLAQKKAAHISAEENSRLLEASFQWIGTQVDTAKATAKQSEAEADVDKAGAERADADLKRAEDLFQRKIISPQEYDAAKAAKDAAQASLKAGQEKLASNRSKIVEAQAQFDAAHKAWDRAQAQARQAEVDVQQAELNLSYARVTAPVSGLVTRKAVQAGDYVQVGQKLLAVVQNDLWVTANFKETQLQDIRTNQPVTITVDSVGGREFAGHVESIQAGSGAAFSLLPPENAVGNYVKVVQRVPVKIVFDKPVEVEHVLGPGMSVVPAVQTGGFEIPAAVVALIAAVIAVVIGIFWWRAANRSTSETARQS